MAMTVKKSADTLTGTRFISNKGKVVDVPMGGTIVAADLVDGSVLLDGSAVGAPSSGIASICKFAKCETGTTVTSLKVLTAGNQFKVGDKVFSLLNGKHYAITAKTTASGVDTMTVGTAIDDPLANGGFIYQNADVADAATAAALLVSPVAITGTNTLVDATTNLLTDLWAIGAVKRGTIGPVVLAALAANYSYISEI